MSEMKKEELETKPVEQETAEEMEPKKPKVKMSERIKKSFQGRKFRAGAYTTAVSIVTIVIILIVNLFVGKFNLKVDLSSNAMFSLTSATKDYLKTLKDDITLYYLVEPDNEIDYYVQLAEKYEAASSHIKLEYKNPTVYPKFASQYTEEDISQNSIIVVDEANGRSKYLDGSKLVKMEFDQQSYQQYPTGIDFEGQVTSALQYVTNEDLPKFYYTKGHQENEQLSVFKELMEKQNVTLEALETVKADKVPEDCRALILLAPQTDYTEDEAKIVKDYLTGGGTAMVFVDYNTNSCPNYSKLLAYYGVSVVDGIVIEDDHEHMIGRYPQSIIPDVSAGAEVLNGYNSKDGFVAAGCSSAIKKADTTRDTITYQPFMTTSKAAYSKTDLQAQTITKEDGDIDGPFDLGAVVTENYNQVTTKLIVMGTSQMIQDAALGVSSYGNYSMMAALIGNMQGEQQSISIPVKYFEGGRLTLTNAQKYFWLYTTIIILPVCIMAVGIFVVLRRRKR